MHLAGVKSERAIELSDSICTGLQLVNFLQHIVEDFERGRVYLPQDELNQYSIEIKEFRDPSQQHALKLLVKSRCEDVLSYLHQEESCQVWSQHGFREPLICFVREDLRRCVQLRRITTVYYDNSKS